MFRVGLTGGIGCGKSTIAKLFSEYGVNIIDTDLIARQLIQPDGPAYQSVIDKFGNDIVNKDKTIDRKKLSAIIFNSNEQKKILENILHPLIWIIVEQQVAEIKSPYCIIMVPLLFEGQHKDRFHTTLVVDIPVEEQIKRVLKRDDRTESEIISIINNQISRSERLKLADDIIDNSVPVDKIKPNIRLLNKKYNLLANNIKN